MAGIQTFGSTVLEEGKRLFYRDNEINYFYENNVFPEKNITLKIHLFQFLSPGECWIVLLWFFGGLFWFGLFPPDFLEAEVYW